jgi:hypothetical protein
MGKNVFPGCELSLAFHAGIPKVNLFRGGIFWRRDYTVRRGCSLEGECWGYFAGRAPEIDEENRMKKIGFLTLLLTATLLLALAFPVSAAGPKSPPSAVAAAPPSPAAAAPTPAPPHPRVHEAIEAMRNAREHMEHAEGEFHGHRAKAIEHLDAAIHEAEMCEREP